MPRNANVPGASHSGRRVQTIHLYMLMQQACRMHFYHSHVVGWSDLFLHKNCGFVLLLDVLLILILKQQANLF